MNVTIPAGRRFGRAAWIILVVAMAFSALVRWRLAEFPLERDEGEYAYAGQLLLEGIPPYCLAYNMKLPGTYLAYAGLMAVFGETTVGIHFGLLVVNLVTIGLVFFLTRDLFDSMTGAMAAVFYMLLSTSLSVFGTAAHATHFVTLFGVAGVWILWRASRSGNAWQFLAAGFLLGLALLMKQHGVFLAGFGGLTALLVCTRQRPMLTRRHAAICGAYAAGAVLPFALTCLWLWWAGVFDRFWFWTFLYARSYLSQVPMNLVIPVFWANAQRVLAINWVIWLLAAVGSIALASDKAVPGRRAFVFGFVLFAALCVVPGYFFRPHYFIVLLPGVAILAGVGAVALVQFASGPRLASWLARAPRNTSARRGAKRASTPHANAAFDPQALARRLWGGLAIAIVVATVAWPIWRERSRYFFETPIEACRATYGANPFVESPVVAEYLKQHTRPGDCIAVFGSEPQIYFYANRHAATSYIYAYPLMELHPFAHAMQEEMIRQIKAERPKYVVLVDCITSWFRRPGSDHYLTDWLNDHLATAYHPVGLVDLLPTGTEYKWDAQAVGAQPRAKDCLWIFKRNP